MSAVIALESLAGVWSLRSHNLTYYPGLKRVNGGPFTLMNSSLDTGGNGKPTAHSIPIQRSTG